MRRGYYSWRASVAWLGSAWRFVNPASATGLGTLTAPITYIVVLKILYARCGASLQTEYPIKLCADGLFPFNSFAWLRHIQVRTERALGQRTSTPLRKPREFAAILAQLECAYRLPMTCNIRSHRTCLDRNACACDSLSAINGRFLAPRRRDMRRRILRRSRRFGDCADRSPRMRVTRGRCATGERYGCARGPPLRRAAAALERQPRRQRAHDRVRRRMRNDEANVASGFGDGPQRASPPRSRVRATGHATHRRLSLPSRRHEPASAIRQIRQKENRRRVTPGVARRRPIYIYAKTHGDARHYRPLPIRCSAGLRPVPQLMP